MYYHRRHPQAHRQGMLLPDVVIPGATTDLLLLYFFQMWNNAQYNLYGQLLIRTVCRWTSLWLSIRVHSLSAWQQSAAADKDCTRSYEVTVMWRHTVDSTQIIACHLSIADIWVRSSLIGHVVLLSKDYNHVFVWSSLICYRHSRWDPIKQL